MALNLKSPEVERLVTQTVLLTGESKTEAIRHALAERLVRIVRRGGLVSRGIRIHEFLRSEIWPLLPTEAHSVEGGPSAAAGDGGASSMSELVIREMEKLGLRPERYW